MSELPFDQYWQWRMEGAALRLRAAKQLMSHPGTRGSLAENLLRELIADFLPQRWGVGTGFIMDSERGRSKQVDILVYDLLTTSPIYRDGDLVFLSPGTARVAVEVKSQLDKKMIPEAFTNIRSAKQVDSALTGLVFGYDGVQAPSFMEHVASWAKEAADARRSEWPDRVYNMEQMFLAFPEKAVGDIAPPAGSAYVARKADDPIVRFFLTEVLTRLELTNLRPFMRADRMGAELGRI